jgi:putative toxin-antitoxin system antitoxin component (TIGR02293 family)
LPHNLWHNVRMSQAASIPVSPHPAFQLDWQSVENGVPLTALDEFSAYSGIPIKDLLEIVIPPRTLKHRRERNEPLNLDESDRLARVARFYELAVKVFGDSMDGREWLTFPIDRFHGKTALQMLRTDAGARQVEEMLYQIDEGVFA